jgi:hypothetical protein
MNDIGESIGVDAEHNLSEIDPCIDDSINTIGDGPFEGIGSDIVMAEQEPPNERTPLNLDSVNMIKYDDNYMMMNSMVETELEHHHEPPMTTKQNCLTYMRFNDHGELISMSISSYFWMMIRLHLNPVSTLLLIYCHKLLSNLEVNSVSYDVHSIWMLILSLWLIIRFVILNNEFFGEHCPPSPCTQDPGVNTHMLFVSNSPPILSIIMDLMTVMVASFPVNISSTFIYVKVLVSLMCYIYIRYHVATIETRSFVLHCY